MRNFPLFGASLGLWILTLWGFLFFRPKITASPEINNGASIIVVRPDLMKTTTLILHSSNIIDSVQYMPTSACKIINMKNASIEIPSGARKVQFKIHSKFPLKSVRIADSGIGWLHAFPLTFATAWLLYLIVLQSNLPLIARHFAIGALLRFLYTIATPWNIRAWDAAGHADYIRRIVSEGALPCASACWECYHPPLYYLVASIFWSSATVLGLPGESGAVLLGLVCSLALLWFGLEIFHKRLDDETFISIGLLFAVWPPFIQQAGKINNDVFITLFSGLALHQAWAWTLERKRRHLYWCGLWCLLSMLSKGNGSLTAILVAWILVSGNRTATLRQNLKELIPFLLMLPCLLFAPWLSSQRAASAQSSSELLVGNITQQSMGSIAQPYGLGQLTHIDFISWFSAPNTNAGDLTSFWNSIGKNILFSQFPFPNEALTIAGYPALFLFTLLVGATIIHASKKTSHWLGGCVICLSALFLFRTRYPFTCSLDIRYVPGFVFFFLIGVSGINSKWLSPLAKWLTISIIILYLTPLIPSN